LKENARKCVDHVWVLRKRGSTTKLMNIVNTKTTHIFDITKFVPFTVYNKLEELIECHLSLLPRQIAPLLHKHVKIFVQK